MSVLKAADRRRIAEAMNHISTTKRKSFAIVDGELQCLYTGSGCAFRPAIKNIDEEREMSASTYLREMSQHLYKWARDCDGPFADRVQICHDNCEHTEGDEFVTEFRKALASSIKIIEHVSNSRADAIISECQAEFANVVGKGDVAA